MLLLAGVRFGWESGLFPRWDEGSGVGELTSNLLLSQLVSLEKKERGNESLD